MVARGAVCLLALWAAGCQCSFDAGKLDDLACQVDIDCRPDQDCIEQTCQQRPCTVAADCGARAQFGCLEGFCEAQPADGGVDGGIDAAVRCDGPLDCGDDLACTNDECVDGFCANPTLPGMCAIDAACWLEGNSSPTNVCQVCDPARAPKAWSSDDSIVPSDGVDCTTDRCQAGQPVFTPDDTRCQAGELCSSCAGGCSPTPALTVDCPDVPGTTGGLPLSCTISAPQAGMGDCVSCTPLIGMTSLVRDTFEGCPNLADIGWEGNLQGINCPGPTRLGPDTDRSEQQLVIDGSNSAPERWVDTTGFDAVRLCFDFALDEVDRPPLLSVELNASGVWSEVWNSDALLAVEEAWTNACLDLVALDPLSAGNPALGVRFLPSDGVGGRLGGEIYLDNVAVDGWTSSTLLWPGRVLDADFTDCTLDDWIATGDPVGCPLFANGVTDAAVATNATWTLARDLDLADRCDGLRLGFSVLSSTPDGDETFTAAIDRGAGAVLVWGIERGPIPEDQIVPFEVSLSHVDPGLRLRAPVTLSLTASAQGFGDVVAIDDVWVDGAECQEAPEIVAAGPVAAQEPGVWTVDVTGMARATAHLQCRWADRPETTASDVVQFCVDAECAPGAGETRACGECGTETRRCDTRCRWLDWSPCNDRPCSCCDPYTGACNACCC